MWLDREMEESSESFFNALQRTFDERPAPDDVLSVDNMGLSHATVRNGKLSLESLFTDNTGMNLGKKRGFAGKVLATWGEEGFNTDAGDRVITVREISRKGTDMLESMHGIMDEIEEIEGSMREYGALIICRIYRMKMTALFGANYKTVVYAEMAIVGLV